MLEESSMYLWNNLLLCFFQKYLLLFNSQRQDTWTFGQIQFSSSYTYDSNTYV